MFMSSPLTGKPPAPAIIDQTDPLANGLVWSWHGCEGNGPQLCDSVGAVNLAAVVTGIGWANGSIPAFGSGIALTVASQRFASAALPPSLQVQRPLTIVLGYRCLGAFTANTFFFSLGCSASSPFLTASIFGPTTTGVGLAYGHSTTLAETSTLFTPTVGADYVIVAVFGTSTYALYAFTVGADPVISTGSLTTGAVTYSAPTISIGQNATNANSQIYFAHMYNRALAANEAAMWGSAPQRILRTLWDPAWMQAASALRFRRTNYNRAGSRGAA